MITGCHDRNDRHTDHRRTLAERARMDEVLRRIEAQVVGMLALLDKIEARLATKENEQS